MPWLTSCCCGFSVRSGTKAVAVLSLIYSVFGLLAVGTFNYGKEILHRERLGLEQSRRPTGFQEIRKPQEIFIEPPSDNADIRKQIEMEKFRKMEELMTLYAVSVSVNFLVSLALLLGVKLEKKWLLLPWIIWTALNLVISQAVVLYAPDRTTSTIPDIFSTALMVYCMLCVISYYQTISENPPGSRTNHTTATFSNMDHAANARCASFPNRSFGDDMTVNMPPSPPPAYPAEDPPCYDPPPPYPGLEGEEKSTMLREESELSTQLSNNTTAEDNNQTNTTTAVDPNNPVVGAANQSEDATPPAPPPPFSEEASRQNEENSGDTSATTGEQSESGSADDGSSGQLAADEKQPQQAADNGDVSADKKADTTVVNEPVKV